MVLTPALCRTLPLRRIFYQSKTENSREKVIFFFLIIFGPSPLTLREQSRRPFPSLWSLSSNLILSPLVSGFDKVVIRLLLENKMPLSLSGDIGKVPQTPQEPQVHVSM